MRPKTVVRVPVFKTMLAKIPHFCDTVINQSEAEQSPQ